MNRASIKPGAVYFRLVQELAADGVVVAVACRVLAVSTSGYYERRGRAPSARAVVDAALTEQIVEIHAVSRGSYGASRVHSELRLGRGVRCGRKRVARLMRLSGLQGVFRRKRKRHHPDPAVHDDLVRRLWSHNIGSQVRIAISGGLLRARDTARVSARSNNVVRHAWPISSRSAIIPRVNPSRRGG